MTKRAATLLFCRCCKQLECVVHPVRANWTSCRCAYSKLCPLDQPRYGHKSRMHSLPVCHFCFHDALCTRLRFEFVVPVQGIQAGETLNLFCRYIGRRGREVSVCLNMLVKKTVLSLQPVPKLGENLPSCSTSHSVVLGRDKLYRLLLLGTCDDLIDFEIYWRGVVELLTLPPDRTCPNGC
jgi:hypothetical protein